MNKIIEARRNWKGRDGGRATPPTLDNDANVQKCYGCGATIPDGEGSYLNDRPYCDKCTNPAQARMRERL